jgi:hypothetical protein
MSAFAGELIAPIKRYRTYLSEHYGDDGGISPYTHSPPRKKNVCDNIFRYTVKY